MVIKIQSLSFILIMIILFSSVVTGQDRPNLIIGGIWQTAKDQETNQGYANDLNAEYVHTYYTGWEYNPQDIAAVTDGTPQMTVYKDPSTGAIVPVPETASYKPTDLNGLTSDLLSQGPSNPRDHYDTIYTHSGGARTAVTALLYQHVTADSLVLISPAMGPMDRELYLWEIQQLLDLGIVKEIVVYQSAVDTPWFNEQWLGKFNPGEIEGNFNIIGVSKEQLGGKTGNAAHEQLWYTALNLELGRDPMSPAPKRSDEITPSAADMIATAAVGPIGRTLDWIIIKRNDINLAIECEDGTCGKQDKYGHYWIEILDGPDGNPVESYGWWPMSKVSPMETLVGVQGELNGVTSFGGTPTSDPHQGDTADEEFHPRLTNTLTDPQVLDRIHEFVQSYKGEWRWTFGLGQNCRTFQTGLMNYVGLTK